MIEKLRVLDLFSGIGGFSLGLERTGGFRAVAFCEIDPFCRRVLAKHWPLVPIFGDIGEFNPDDVGPTDVISAGYPCQPESLAGKRRGQADDRWLWPQAFRFVKSKRPTWFLGENVAGHVSLGLDEVLSDLGSVGYSARPFVIPACAVGADHERRRVWIIAHLDREGLQERFVQPGIQGEAGCNDDGQDITVGAWRSAQPALVRRLHGIPRRVDRIRALGNAVVPQIPEIIGRAILSYEASQRSTPAAPQAK